MHGINSPFNFQELSLLYNYDLGFLINFKIFFLSQDTNHEANIINYHKLT